MICTRCGADNPEGSAYCLTCGAQMTMDYSQPMYVPPVVTPAASIPQEYKPLNPWLYVCYDLLFSIPLVGLVCIIVFSCSSSGNKNLRSYALSKLCWALISVVLCVLLIAVGVAYADALIDFLTEMY